MDFMQYWQYSDMVTKSLFFVLLVLSIVSWVTGIIRVLQSRKLATSVADDLSQQIQPTQANLADSDAATRRLVTEQTFSSILVVIVLPASVGCLFLEPQLLLHHLSVCSVPYGVFSTHYIISV